MSCLYVSGQMIGQYKEPLGIVMIGIARNTRRDWQAMQYHNAQTIITDVCTLGGGRHKVSSVTGTYVSIHLPVIFPSYLRPSLPQSIKCRIFHTLNVDFIRLLLWYARSCIVGVYKLSCQYIHEYQESPHEHQQNLLLLRIIMNMVSRSFIIHYGGICNSSAG